MSILLSLLLTAAVAPTARDNPAPAAKAADEQRSALAGARPLAVNGSLSRERLVAAVLAGSPSIASARAAWEAARTRPEQARSLDDPRLSYGFAPRSAFESGVRYGQVIGYTQRLPYPGTRRLRGEVAEAEAAAAESELAALRLELATAASLLFDDLYVVERAIEINEEHVDLLESFQRIATARYAAGEAPQQAPLQAEVEHSHLLHRRVVLATERDVLHSRLNALLHRRPGAFLPPSPAHLEEAEARFDRADLDVLVAEALKHRPELAAERARLAADDLEVELAELAFKPGLEVMGTYNTMWGNPEHRGMLGVSVNLPIHRRRLRAARAEAEAEVEMRRSRIDGIADEVRAEVAIRFAELEQARHVVELYRSRLVPAARDQIEAALAGFRTGQNTFLGLIDAERSQRNVRLDQERALAELHGSRARLERAVGRLAGGDVEVWQPTAARETSSTRREEDLR